LLELRVAHSQYLVNNKDFRLQMRGNRKCQTHKHSTGIPLHRCVQKPLNTRKCHNLIKFAAHFGMRHSKDGTIEKNIFATREFGVKPGSDFQQACHAALDPNAPARGFGDSTEHFEQGALPGTIAPDETKHFAAPHLEGNILQCPKFFARSRPPPAPAAQPAKGSGNRRLNRMTQTTGLIGAPAQKVALANPLSPNDDVRCHIRSHPQTRARSSGNTKPRK
jgi:hypothetical protein